MSMFAMKLKKIKQYLPVLLNDAFWKYSIIIVSKLLQNSTWKCSALFSHACPELVCRYLASWSIRYLHLCRLAAWNFDRHKFESMLFLPLLDSTTLQLQCNYDCKTISIALLHCNDNTLQISLLNNSMWLWCQDINCLINGREKNRMESITKKK